jgi:hypothetical protein
LAGSGLTKIFVFIAGVAVGALLQAAVRPSIRKLAGGYFFREGDAVINEAIGLDSPGL